MLPHLHLLFSPTSYDIHEELYFWYNFYQALLDVKRMAVTTDKAAHYVHPPIIADYSNEGQNLRNGNAAAMTNSPCPFWAGKNPKHNPPFLGLLRRWTWRPPLTSSSSRYGFKVEGGVGWGYIRSVKRYCIEYGKEQRVENSP